MPIDWTQTHGQFLRKQKQSQTEVYKQTRDFARFINKLKGTLNARE